MPGSPLILCRVGAVRDAEKVNARPGAIAVRDGRVVAAGEETQVRRDAGKPDRVVNRPDLLVLPGMVNAHAHLDLTNLGPRPYGGNFIDWVRMIMQSREPGDDAIRAAVSKGVAMSRDSGVVLLADIAGSRAAIAERVITGGRDVDGWSFLEVLGFGQHGLDAASDAEREIEGWNSDRLSEFSDHLHDILLGLQPHAPYSTSLNVYRQVNASPGVHSTHLAETREECQFIRDAAGPFADLLRKLGKWHDTIQPRGVSPVQYLRDVLVDGMGRWIVAHCNYVDDSDIQTLASTNANVAYCPIASAYFGHRDHRYRDMLAAGVNVCLGTDSIVCQPPDEPQPLGILPQMRHLYRRDRTDPGLLLAMATTHGKSAMPNFRCVTLSHGSWADLVAVRFDSHDATDALTQALLSREPAGLLVRQFAESISE